MEDLLGPQFTLKFREDMFEDKLMHYVYFNDIDGVPLAIFAGETKDIAIANSGNALILLKQFKILNQEDYDLGKKILLAKGS
jgi:hypothetical protein